VNQLSQITGATKHEVPRPTAAAGAPSRGTAPATTSPEKVVGVTSSTMTCRECDGDGVGKYMALDEMKYVWRECHVCEGSGLEARTCDYCDGTLTDQYCSECEEYTFADRVPPLPEGWSRLAL
jgi:RecJ-like exonuclease